MNQTTTKATPREKLLERAKAHKQLYPTFNLERFMAECDAEAQGRDSWYSSHYDIGKTNDTLRFIRSVTRLAGRD